MSHTMTVKTEVRHVAHLNAACRRLGLSQPVFGEHRLFENSLFQNSNPSMPGYVGWKVVLPGWKYPVVFDLQAGESHADTFNGYWGNQAELDKLMQAYAIEAVLSGATAQGMSATEHVLADGSVELTLTQWS